MQNDGSNSKNLIYCLPRIKSWVGLGGEDQNYRIFSCKTGWENYGPRSACGQRGNFMRPEGQPHVHI